MCKRPHQEEDVIGLNVLGDYKIHMKKGVKCRDWALVPYSPGLKLLAGFVEYNCNPEP